MYDEWVKSWTPQKGVKSGVPERVSISCPTYGTRHDLQTENQSCVTIGEQAVQRLCHGHKL